MKKSEIVVAINNAVSEKHLCKVQYKFFDYHMYLFPLKTGDKLYIASYECDFQFDGYHIGRLSNICDVQMRKPGDKLFDILESEGLSRYYIVPDVDLSDWKSVFTSLQKAGKFIIIRDESDYDSPYAFVIGKIIKVKSRSVLVMDFDCDGEWYEEPLDIPFSSITSVSFDGRYSEVFSKYI